METKSKQKSKKQISFYFLLNKVFKYQKITNISESGFSLLEVLVTILVISGFLLGSLQATVLSTLLRVQAEDKQQTNNWIQNDLDLIKYQASTLPDSSTICQASNYGESLRSNLTNTSFSTTQKIQIDGKAYQVFRNYIPLDNTLQINYTIAYAPEENSTSAHPRYDDSFSYTLNSLPAPNQTNPNVIATLTTEVIPDAVFTCT